VYAGTGEPGEGFSPDGISPDCTRVALWRIRPSDGKTELIVANVDGSPSITLVSSSDFSADYSAWLPDGEHLIYIRSAGMLSAVHKIKVDGTNDTLIANLGSLGVGYLQVSPNGRYAVLNGVTNADEPQPDLWLVDTETGIATNITNSADRMEYGGGFSPDSRSIVFSSIRVVVDPLTGEWTGLASEIRMYDIQQARTITLATETGGWVWLVETGNSAWNPNGSEVVASRITDQMWLNHTYEPMQSEVFRLSVMPGAPIAVTGTADCEERAPAWTLVASELKIRFSAYCQVEPEPIWKFRSVDADGSNTVDLPSSLAGEFMRRSIVQP
jgi:hypothetical protein